jgi:hypothetical protein
MIPGLQRQRSLDFTLEGPEGSALISEAEARMIGCSTSCSTLTADVVSRRPMWTAVSCCTTRRFSTPFGYPTRLRSQHLHRPRKAVVSGWLFRELSPTDLLPLRLLLLLYRVPVFVFPLRR